VRFDALILDLANLGYDSWADLTPANRTRLIRLYFEETSEWGDALYERMAPVFDAFEHHDDADFGLAVRQKMTAYVMPYAEKQLKYQVACKRERGEIEERLTEIDPEWRQRFRDHDLAAQFYAKEL
jgi:hypothetical protein